jgi:putative SOS response-associated peptidase YedK
MCGRFTLTKDPIVLAIRLGAVDARREPFRPRYNIAPGQPVDAIVQAPGGERRLGRLIWGLIPRWSQEPKGFINARSETILEKPSFADAFRRRRCLIPADGFYEWAPTEGRKRQPYAIRFAAKDDILAFAGIWDRWKTPNGQEIYTCAILTCAANQTIARIHHRMPVVFSEEESMLLWINPDTNLSTLQKLLKPLPNEITITYQVSRHVNNVRNDDPKLLEPVK